MKKILLKLNRIIDYIKAKGLVNTGVLIVKKIIIKPLKGYYNYLRIGSNYTQNIIFVAGFAKSGSTWIANILTSLKGFDSYNLSQCSNKEFANNWNDFSKSDIYPKAFSRFQRRLAVIKGHTWGTTNNINLLENNNLKYLIIVRDPRDKIISEYYYIKNNPKHWDHHNAIKMSLNDYITFKFESGEFEQQSINWIRTWLNNYNREFGLIVKYEEMLKEPFQNFKIILNFLHIDISDQECEEIIEKNSFKKITGRKEGIEDKKSFYRKGVAGEWVTIFNAEQKYLFKSIGEDIIKKLNYSPTE